MTGASSSICAAVMNGRKCLGNWERDRGQIREGGREGGREPRLFHCSFSKWTLPRAPRSLPPPERECSVVVGQKHAKKGERESERDRYDSTAARATEPREGATRASHDRTYKARRTKLLFCSSSATTTRLSERHGFSNAVHGACRLLDHH